MTDQASFQDVPPGIIDLLRIFLAASSRGEDAALTLETRRKVISTKFRSVESNAGAPAAPTNISSAKKRKNPARAKRSRLRLEDFMKRKVEEKKQAESSLAAGHSTNSTTSKLIVELDKEKDEQQDRSMGVDLTSPIPQVDGAEWNISQTVQYKFVSDYHQDDIGDALEELFPAGNAKLVSCVAPRPRESADQNCIVAIRRIDRQDTSWPEMMQEMEPVFRELLRIQ
jgi:hypothetical protein